MSRQRVPATGHCISKISKEPPHSRSLPHPSRQFEWLPVAPPAHTGPHIWKPKGHHFL